MPPTIGKFITSGLKHNTTPPRVSRVSYPQINRFEINYLFSHPIYRDSSPIIQETLQFQVQESFFAWMMSNRKAYKSTTQQTKSEMYKIIVDKVLNPEFLSPLHAPPFYYDDSPVFESHLHESPTEFGDSLVFESPSQDLRAISFTGEIPDGVIPYSQPLYIPIQVPQEDIFSNIQNILQFPSVTGVLHDISEIQRLISEVCNTPTFDSTLRPYDW